MRLLYTTFRLPFVPSGDSRDISLTLDAPIEFSRNMANYLPDGGFDMSHPLKHMMEQGTLIPAEHSISRLYIMRTKHEICLTDHRKRCSICYRAGDAYH